MNISKEKNNLIKLSHAAFLRDIFNFFDFIWQYAIYLSRF